MTTWEQSLNYERLKKQVHHDLRDKFAITALTVYWNDVATMGSENTESAAKWAYQMADAMLAERDREN